MHTLHTTSAFVLQAYPHGESSKTYKLLTREKGLLYAHGQGVRELKSRNKYALQTGDLSEITLVQGREKWRITGAQILKDASVPRASRIYKHKILNLIGSLLPIEDPVREVFAVLEGGTEALAFCSEKKAPLVETIVMLRLMDKLGFMARPCNDPIVATFLDAYTISEELLERAVPHTQFLMRRVHNALMEAK
jgi:recombinational DNA repair protein (RecF pathway)